MFWKFGSFSWPLSIFFKIFIVDYTRGSYNHKSGTQTLATVILPPHMNNEFPVVSNKINRQIIIYFCNFFTQKERCQYQMELTWSNLWISKIISNFLKIRKFFLASLNFFQNIHCSKASYNHESGTQTP